MSITPEQERAFNAKINEAIYGKTCETMQVPVDLLFGFRGEKWTRARLCEAANRFLLTTTSGCCC